MYFDHLKTMNEVKDRYKILAKRLHPDVGGDKTIMQEINADYQTKISRMAFDDEDFVGDIRQKVEMVMDWAAENKDFDDSFVTSLLVRLDMRVSLTDKQIRALDNIINKFKITRG